MLKIPSVILRFRKLKKKVASIGRSVKARKLNIQGERNKIPVLNSRHASKVRFLKNLKDGITFRIFENSSSIGCFLSSIDGLGRSALLTCPNYTLANLLVVDAV